MGSDGRREVLERPAQLPEIAAGIAEILRSSIVTQVRTTLGLSISLKLCATVMQGVNEADHTKAARRRPSINAASVGGPHLQFVSEKGLNGYGS